MNCAVNNCIEQSGDFPVGIQIPTEMANRLFISLGLAAALMTAGCAGKNAGQAQPEEAPAAETVQTTENTENAENAGTQDESIEAEPITDNTDGSTEEVPVEAEDVNEAAAPVD